MQNIRAKKGGSVMLHDRNSVSAYARTLRYVQRGIEQPVQTTRSARSLHLLTIILMFKAAWVPQSSECVRASVLETTAECPQDGLLVLR